jgi:AraC family transcriptional regulator
MPLIRKAVWYAETRLDTAFALSEAAEACGVTPFHLTRAFGAASGVSYMAYVRARRLSEAAKRLAAGAKDILALALDHGYGSHEAFTRAFREHFDLTPEAVRARATTEGLILMAPLAVDAAPLPLETPRFETRAAFLLAGYAERYTMETNHAIPALWGRFAPLIGHVPNQRGFITYGIGYDTAADESFVYAAAVEVTSFEGLGPEFARIAVPAQSYAVFTHRGHISRIRETWGAIMGDWLPASGRRLAGGPDFELYPEDFEPEGPKSAVEIWIPLAD